MDSGGSERQTWNLLRGIDRQRFEPRLYLLYQQGPLLEQLPSDVAVDAYWSRHQPPRLNWPGRVHRLQIADLTNILRRDRIDVVYERLFHMAMIAGPATRRAGVRHVANIVSPPRSDVPRSEIKFAWLKRLVLSRAYREADRLLAVSRGAADDAAAYYGIDRRKFEVIWNPVDLERLDRLKNDAWSGLPFDESTFKFVSVGRLSHEKGHGILIRAFAEFLAKRTEPNRFELHLVGAGPLSDSLKALASELRIENQIVFHGYVDNPYPLVHRAQLFVLPSLYEGLPNALLEAMACEVPTLVTDCPGGIREATDEGRLSRLVPPNDQTALAEAMDERIEIPKPYLARVKPSRIRIESMHSFAVWIDKMKIVLSQGPNVSPWKTMK